MSSLPECKRCSQYIHHGEVICGKCVVEEIYPKINEILFLASLNFIPEKYTKEQWYDERISKISQKSKELVKFLEKFRKG